MLIDPLYRDAITTASGSTKSQRFHIDAVTRTLGSDVEADRDRTGQALRILVDQGRLEAVHFPLAPIIHATAEGAAETAPGWSEP
jgi:hypothetical protein